ncbi:MAG: cadherin-like domain-containing protein, partial [Psychrilyobacter sp.]|nr:cadherin-like domain-containing protein [Psychrilyobacter sp.]
VYYRDTGKIYANLPNGAYTKLSGFEIWTPGLDDYSGSGSISINAGQTMQIDPPADPVPPTSVFPAPTYTLKDSSDNSIATVSSSGVLTGVSAGTAVVLETVSPLVSEITVTVIPPSVFFNDDTNLLTDLPGNSDTQIITGNLISNDTTDGGNSDFAASNPGVLVGTYGTLTVNSDGTYSYELDNDNTAVIALSTGESVIETLNIDIIENISGNVGTSALTITISGSNDSPIAGSITANTLEDTMIVLAQADLLANSSDLDSNNTLVASNIQSSNATVVNNGDGTYSITPRTNLHGMISLTFDVSDGVDTASSTIELNVTGVADAPIISINKNLEFDSDDFESGTNGWGGSTTTVAAFETGAMLGQNGGTATYEKTYEIPDGISSVEIAFTVHEINSWDDENLNVFVEGVEVSSIALSHTGRSTGSESGTTNINGGGVTGSITHGTDGIVSGTGKHSTGAWSQSHYYTLIVPVASDQTSIKLGVSSTLNDTIGDESWGLDDVILSVAAPNVDSVGVRVAKIDITTEVSDNDGSETIGNILISDVPNEVTLSNGTDNGDGTWLLTTDDLVDLTATPDSGYNGITTLKVESTSIEGDPADNTSQTTLQTFKLLFTE